MPEWIGKIIGKVRIEKLLARGGMAEVYLGSHLTLERPVAVKVLHSYIEEEPILLERFQREARVVAGLRHPNIVQIFDFDTMDGHPYIVMEYLRGPTLATYLRHIHQRKKRVPLQLVARLLHQLTSALDYAHGQSVIHRDIKPGNILLHTKTDNIALDQTLPNDVEAIVTDFGLVRVVNAASQTVSGFISGTPAYASPEQARGDQTDHRTDLYSLGVVLYEMLAGRIPFEADNTVTILHMHLHTNPAPISGASPKVQAVVDRALRKNPDERYQSSQEMASDFYRAIGMTAQAEAIPLPEPRASAELIEQPSEVAVSWLPKPAPVEPEPPPVVPAAKSQPARVLPEPAPKAKPVVTEQVQEPKTAQKSESIPKPKPMVTEQVQEPKLVQKSESTPKPKPVPVPPEPAPKPARNRSWMGIGVGLFSLVLLILLGLGGYRLFLAARSVPKSTETLSSALPLTDSSPAATEAPALPSSTGMVEIPAGTYFVGRDPEDEFHAKSQPITLNSFWIDQYQTTNSQYAQYMTETGAPAPEIWPAEGDHPVRGVTWDQALAYCSWAKKRLPSEAEWEVSGRGSGTAPELYPWGNDATAGGKTSDLPDEDTYPVGTLAFNKSPLGVFDMVGNVWEWVGEPYAVGQEGYKFVRGGRFGLPVLDLAYRLGIPPGDTRYTKYTGFRCAADQVQ